MTKNKPNKEVVTLDTLLSRSHIREIGLMNECMDLREKMHETTELKKQLDSLRERGNSLVREIHYIESKVKDLGKVSIKNIDGISAKAKEGIDAMGIFYEEEKEKMKNTITKISLLMLVASILFITIWAYVQK